MAGSTSNRTLAPGGVLWGQSFVPVTFVPPDDLDGIATQIDGSADTLTAGTTTLTLDGVLAATGTNGTWTPCAMPLCFVANGTYTATWQVTGKNQFGEDVVESVSLSPAGAATYTYTNHCYTFISEVLVTAVSGWSVVGDTLTVGYDANANSNTPVPLPFKVKDTGHVPAVSIAGTTYTPASVSTVYWTATIDSADTDFGGGTSLLPATILLVPGAQAVY